MILLVCAGDPELIHIGRHASLNNRCAFGRPYQMFSRLLPVIAASEDLFVLARAAYREQNTPLIGDRDDALFVDPAELIEIVAAVCPSSFVASVRICVQSRNVQDNAMQFARRFQQQFRSRFIFGAGVYGCSSPADQTIPLPSDPRWIAANDPVYRIEGAVLAKK